MIMQDTHTNKI